MFSPDETDGYLVAPTPQDVNNALQYASLRAVKKVCESDPKLYTWVPDKVLPYPCPEGLDCVFGKCEFTQQGCDAASSPDYFDCERVTVPCDVPGHPDGKCEMCKFNIRSVFDKDYDIPQIAQKCTSADCANCAPGDKRYFTYTNPEEDEADVKDDPAAAGLLCKPKFDPPPYLLNGREVPCKNDTDCATYGLGGACMLYEGRQATGKCVDTGPGYLEYRQKFTQFPGDTPKGQCVRVLPLLKQWCEMPWSRPGPKEDPPGATLQQKIDAHPRQRMHPPFYYNEADGECYMTKSYCKNAVNHGGFEVGFGESKKVLFGSFDTCAYGYGKDNMIQQGYDCCTPFGQSLPQFFLGKTLVSEMRDVTTGKMSLGEFIAANPADAMGVGAGMAAGFGLLAFLSDAELKIEKKLVYPDFAAPGVHGYTFRWSPQAQALYPEYTTDQVTMGILASDVATLYPQAVLQNEQGHSFIVNDQQLAARDPTYRRIVNALKLFHVYAHLNTA